MISRRFLLKSAALAACSAAAHPWMTTLTLASGDRVLGDNRLVVIILRGAMDGLGTVMPVEDPLFAQYRPTLSRQPEALPLTGGFALNPALAELAPLWHSGQLSFVHATSTPYRDTRSHFDGQDILEAGTGTDVGLAAVRDGWLNRLLQSVPGLTAETAYAVGRDAVPILEGPAPVRNWAPDLRLRVAPATERLLEAVYHDDPLFRDAAEEAMTLSDAMEPDAMMAAAPKGAVRLSDVDKLADFAAERLRGETRIAAFSLTGWDTHANQASQLGVALSRLQRTILRLRESVGPEVWSKTMVISMTEFGRTVRENGTKGTDHGTGGLSLLAGGAVKGGRIFGDWPGLGESDLYSGRDLLPTSDVRSWAAWAMKGMYGLDRSVLEGSIFPGLDMGRDPGILA